MFGLHLVAGASMADLGAAVGTADESLSAIVQMPRDYPAGYAELIISRPHGARSWSTWVLIG